MDGWETVGNKLGGSFVVRERRFRDDRVDGRETVGNSLGRALLGGSDTSATTGWTDGKPWEIAWGEPRLEGARRKYGHRGRWEEATY